MNIFEKEKKYMLQTYKRHPLYITKASGKYVWDDAGRRYLDFFSGLSVCSVGHCHQDVVASVKGQVEKVMHTSNLYYTEPQVLLAEQLSIFSLKGKVFFSNSGAEANECAVKLARKNSGSKKYKVITFTDSFHGRTLAMLAATGQEKFHADFGPLPTGFVYARFNDIQSVKKKIDHTVCGVLIEPVQGEGGVNIADKNFIKELRVLCSRKNILLMFDEVQCGLGRTGTRFAYEHYGIKPDILTLAKSLGGGLPIGATITTPHLASVFAKGDHGSTFGGNPVSCAAAGAMLKLLTPVLLDHVSEVGAYFIKKLLFLQKGKKCIIDVRGKGLMIGIELNKAGAPVVEECQKKGLLINCTQDTVLRFLPPFDITKHDVDLAIKILSAAL